MQYYKKNTALRLLRLIILVLISKVTFGQENHWIYFKERGIANVHIVSEKTYQNRRMLGLPEYQVSDFGPKDNEVKFLSDLGVQIRYSSRWLNAVSASLNREQLNKLTRLPFIEKIEPFTTTGFLSIKDTNNVVYLTYPLTQINSVEFLNRGWVGDGVDIGVIDGGFHNLDKDVLTSHLVDNNRILRVKDFFEPNRSDFFSGKRNNGELHGTHVVGYIGGFSKTDKAVTGLGLRADYFLAKTETSGREARVEEDNWIAAVEWLDSLGVRLVNSSLGYALGFTNPKENYSPSQMDGKTSVIGMGAKKAVLEKGMIIVSAAGNEGENEPWKGLVSTPGDVEEVISVGACSPEGAKMGYSSIGPHYTNFIKPDICVYSNSGTSLAAPIITGVIAAMLQEHPALTWREIKSVLQTASSNADFPNNYIGYGWPDLEKAAQILDGIKIRSTAMKIEASEFYDIESIENIAVFHKQDYKIVIKQELLEPKNKKVKISRPKNAMFSTVVSKNKNIEIIWKP